MKKKLFLVAAAVAMLVCLFALSVSADDVDGISYSFSGSNATVTGLASGSTATEIVIPETVTSGEKTYTVTAIGANAFSGNETIIEVTLPSTVTSLGNNAFKGCSNLTTVNTGYITSYGQACFQSCKALDGIVLNENVTAIPTDFCHYASALTSITIPANVTSIGGYAFHDCTSLETVTNNSAKIKTVNASAFAGCSKLTGITLPDTVTEIGSNAFNGCKAMQSFYFPSSLKTLGRGAFHSCSGLQGEIVLPETVTSIPQDCFHFCSKITKINVPGDCTEIGNYAFDGCSKLTVLDMTNAKSLKTTGTNNNCPFVELIFPEGLVTFGGIQNDALETLILPNSVTSMGIIKSNQLTEFVVPAGVTSLSNKAFDHCTSLKTLTLPKGLSITTTDNTSFYNSRNVTTLIYTGDESDEIVTTLKEYLTSAEFVYANHCETYYDGNHTGEETYNFTSFVEASSLSVSCTVCGETKVSQSYEPVISVSGFSVPLYDGAKGMAFSYTINNSALNAHILNTGNSVTYGILVATGDNFKTGTNVMTHSFTGEYMMVEVVLNYGDVEGVDDIDVVMACSVTATDSLGETETEYYQPATEKEKTEYTSTVYGTLYGASYNDLK